ncbi:MAG: fused MFS/spermidine synthase [Sedimentisphaerales bacterium]|nr:fused MFS/spermidine synthase [Sedimentisphaerales bacterium]
MNNNCNYYSEQITGKQPGVVIVYVLAVFLSAFLLFTVQLLMGRYVLPWFGGGPEVWTVCMLFFQVLLLAGYAYAHLSDRFLSCRAQAIFHVVLLSAAIIAIPIIPEAKLKPASGGNPTLQIMALLGLCVGLPYFALSATGPLLQRWFSRIESGKTHYRLYAFSNAASLLGLLSYPFVFEPVFTRAEQAELWAYGLVIFSVLCVLCAVVLYRHSGCKERIETAGEKDYETAGAPGWKTRLLWLGLTAAASVELLAVTNKICQDVAVIPFLWVVPLCLYLLSFIICFHSERWYARRVFLSLFILSIVGVILAGRYEADIGVKSALLIYCSMLFFCCMVCHGELFRLRPAAEHLTGFYLMVAVGGAAGGIFVGVIAPVIFNTYIELYAGITGCALFVLLADKSGACGTGVRRRVWVALLITVTITAGLLQSKRNLYGHRSILNTRNFFGVMTIWEDGWDKPDEHKYIMQHGTTFHGLQFLNEAKRLKPTTYYNEKSGIGLVLENLKTEDGRRIGAIGLGVGTIATYGGKDDYFRFYEINPEVVRLAKDYFSYLRDCRSKVDIIIGDGRLSLESEEPQEFDVLVIDAFASDAVPVHLLTKEAFEIYLKHIKPNGVVAVHISSRYLDLKSVVWKQAKFFNLKNAWIESGEDNKIGILASDWILLSNNDGFINSEVIKNAATPKYDDYKKIQLWTDEHLNMFEILI